MVKLWQSLQLEVTPICSNWQLVACSYLHEPGPALCQRCSIFCWCNTSSGGPIFEEFSFVLVAQLFYFGVHKSMIIHSKFSNKNYFNKNLCFDSLLDICLFIIDFFHIFSFFFFFNLCFYAGFNY
jgi:hypothetical protein